MYKPVKTEVIPDVFWVGVNDWSIRTFHGLDTDEGSSYNSYLIMDEKPTLIDTVKCPFAQEHIERIQSVIELSKIEYLVMNHSEPDHSGAITKIYALMPQATIITNMKCKENLELLYPELKTLNPKWLVVDNKSQLNIGTRTLSFIPVPMIHWPCNMFTYCKADSTLYSNDGFGQHLATTERWADQLPLERVMHIMNVYNANILAHIPVLIKNALVQASKLDIKYILTAHGVGWRGETIALLLEEYSRLANQSYKKKVAIIFDSMYGSTAKAAIAMSEGVKSTGAMVDVVDLKASSLTAVALYMFDSACFAFGSPAINSTMMPLVESAINHCRGLKLLAGKTGAIFGAYGWAGAPTINDMTEALKKCNANIDEVKLQWKLQVNDEILVKSYEMGVKLGMKALEIGK